MFTVLVFRSMEMDFIRECFYSSFEYSVILQLLVVYYNIKLTTSYLQIQRLMMLLLEINYLHFK